MQNFIKLANENPWFALTLILVLILIFNIIKRTHKWVLLTYITIYIMLTCIFLNKRLLVINPTNLDILYYYVYCVYIVNNTIFLILSHII